MKPFRYPRLWLGLWWLAILLVIVLSVLPPAPLPSLPSGFDKLGHFSAYFLLAAAAVQLFASRYRLLACAVLLVLLGMALEWVQGSYTVTRMQDPRDALANTLGVVGGLLTVLSPLRDAWLGWERRRFSSSAQTP